MQSAAPLPSSPINIARQTQSAVEPTTFNRECLCQKCKSFTLACFLACLLHPMFPRSDGVSLPIPIPCYLLPPTSNRPFPFVYTPNGIKPKLLLLLLQHQLPAFFVRSPLLLFAKPSGWKNYSRCDNFFSFFVCDNQYSQFSPPPPTARPLSAIFLEPIMRTQRNRAIRKIGTWDNHWLPSLCFPHSVTMLLLHVTFHVIILEVLCP